MSFPAHLVRKVLFSWGIGDYYKDCKKDNLVRSNHRVGVRLAESNMTALWCRKCDECYWFETLKVKTYAIFVVTISKDQVCACKLAAKSEIKTFPAKTQFS